MTAQAGFKTRGSSASRFSAHARPGAVIFHAPRQRNAADPDQPPIKARRGKNPPGEPRAEEIVNVSSALHLNLEATLSFH